MNLIKRIIRELRKNSLPDFVRKTLFYYFGKGRLLWALNSADWARKKFLVKREFAKYKIGNRSGKDRIIVWVIPGTWISGGIAVVVRHANMLQERGYRVFLVTQDLKATIPWFTHQKVKVVPMSRISVLLEEGIDILIATGWNSAPTVDLLPAKRKLYFVQSDERKFYDDPVMKQFVGTTYDLPFEYLTMAHFLQAWLREEFDQSSTYVPNGLDVAVFHPVVVRQTKTDKVRVLIEGPINIPFKGVAEAYEAVAGLDCELWLVSSNGVPPSHWKYDQFFERTPIHEMPQIYSSCDILLKMSTVESFCYPPLEMMACGGVPVILEVSGIEEYARHEENCLIVQSQQEARQAVARLIADPALRARLRRGGLETAKKWSWERSVDALEEVILRADSQ